MADEGIKYIIETFFTGIPFAIMTFGEGRKSISRPGRMVIQENTEFEYILRKMRLKIQY